jgi:hypothetical protein
MEVEEEGGTRLAFRREARVRDEEKFWFTWCTSFEEDAPELPYSIFARSEAPRLSPAARKLPSSEDIRSFERVMSCGNASALSTLSGFERLSFSAPAFTGTTTSSLGIVALRSFNPCRCRRPSSAVALTCPSAVEVDERDDVQLALRSEAQA